MRRQILAGALAGMAGTTALNAATYLDMAIRGRAPSSTPEHGVETLVHLVGTDVPGQGAQRENRLSGLGALTGIVTGTAAGTAYGVLGAVVGKPAAPWSVLVAGAVAMLGGNVPMAVLGISDPRSWSAADWLSDVLPHLAYGVVTAVTYDLAG